jgi:hypothetical protein
MSAPNNKRAREKEDDEEAAAAAPAPPKRQRLKPLPRRRVLATAAGAGAAGAGAAVRAAVAATLQGVVVTAAPTAPAAATKEEETSEAIIERFAPHLWAKTAPRAMVELQCKQFLTRGAVSVHLFTPAMQYTATAFFNGCLEHAVTHAPEFPTAPQLAPKAGEKVVPIPMRPALGGFGATQFPSADHAPAMRALRVLQYINTITLLRRGHAKRQIFAQLGIDAEGEELATAMKHDRPLTRVTGQRAEKKAWHRDCGSTQEAAFMAGASFGAQIGGWVALKGHQEFAFVPGSHLDEGVRGKVIDGGFAHLSKADIVDCEAHVESIFAVPGMSILLFESLRHTTSGKEHKARTSMNRLFTAAVVAPKPFIYQVADKAERAKLTQQLRDGAAMPLKSGQIRNMAPKTYWNYPKTVAHMVNFAKRAAPAIMETRTRKTSQRTFKDEHGVKRREHFDPPLVHEHVVCKNVCPSLVEQGLAGPAMCPMEWDAYFEPCEL